MQHTPTQGNRWLVASMGTLLQLCLGTVYAWSYFQKPTMERFGWSNSQTAWTFSIAIAALGLAAAWGGMNLANYGPRRLARIGSILFSAGYLLGALAFALKSLALLYLGYGIIGGIGLGLSYVTPVATVAKWFPDKKGLGAGMVGRPGRRRFLCSGPRWGLEWQPERPGWQLVLPARGLGDAWGPLGCGRLAKGKAALGGAAQAAAGGRLWEWLGAGMVGEAQAAVG